MDAVKSLSYIRGLEDITTGDIANGNNITGISKMVQIAQVSKKFVGDFIIISSTKTYWESENKKTSPHDLYEKMRSDMMSSREKHEMTRRREDFRGICRSAWQFPEEETPEQLQTAIERFRAIGIVHGLQQLGQLLMSLKSRALEREIHVVCVAQP